MAIKASILARTRTLLKIDKPSALCWSLFLVSNPTICAEPELIDENLTSRALFSGMTMSLWILDRALPSLQRRFADEVPHVPKMRSLFRAN